MKVKMVKDRVIALIGLKVAGDVIEVSRELGFQLIGQGFAVEMGKTKAPKKETDE